MMPIVLPLSLLLMQAPPIIQTDASARARRVANMERSVSVSPPGMWDRSRRAMIAVEALGGGQALWSGTLRVGASTGASVNRSTTQAPPTDCPGDERGRYRAQQNSFNLNLHMQNNGDQGTSYGFSVNWQRPDDDCSEAMIQRSVQLSGNVALDPGKTVTVEGDAGLVLRMRLVSENEGAKEP